MVLEQGALSGKYDTKHPFPADSDRGAVYNALEAHYKTLVRYLNLEDMGMVLGYGCGIPSMTQHSEFPQQAYNLGNRLK